MRKLPVWIEKAGGLDFGCTQCGDCCTGAPGFVWVGAEEIERLASFLGIAREQFGLRYLRRVGDHLSLIEKTNGDCVFWERGEGCTVYAARPVQCRTYPFWPEIVASKARWRSESGFCPGIRNGNGHFDPPRVHALMNGAGET